MRVPNTGLDLELRQIIAEGYRLAEHLLRDYRDPPGLMETLASGIDGFRQMARGVYRAVVRE